MTVPIYNFEDEWALGTLQYGILLDVTDTDSLAGSKVIELRVDGTAVFSVDKDGNHVAGKTAYGMISCNENSTAEATTDATPRKIAAFDTDGPTNKVTADSTTDNDLEVLVAGTYKVELHISFSGTLSKTFRVAIYKNGVSTGIELHRKLGTGGDIGSASCGGIVELSANDLITAYHWSTDGGTAFTADDAQLSVHRISD